MKLEFLGFKQQGNAGCSVCGKRKSSNYTFQREKKMVLPSGRRMTFFAGQTYEVSEVEGKFLLAQTYLTGTEQTMIFKEVK